MVTMSDRVAIRATRAAGPAATYSQGISNGGILRVATGLVDGALVETDALAVLD
jgi:hypothetical protein